MTISRVVTAGLKDWSTVGREREWSALLIGNGASRVVWPQFDYPSLYQQASLSRSDLLPHSACMAQANG
jgi:hypothetical protein